MKRLRLLLPWQIAEVARVSSHSAFIPTSLMISSLYIVSIKINIYGGDGAY